MSYNAEHNARSLPANRHAEDATGSTRVSRVVFGVPPKTPSAASKRTAETLPRPYRAVLLALASMPAQTLLAALDVFSGALKTTRVTYILPALFLALASLAQAEQRQDSALIVVGAEGTAEYGKHFASQAKIWQEVCAKAGVAVETIGLGQEAKATDLEALKARLEKESQAKDAQGTLWLVIMGHGTFDGREAKLSLRGDDVSAEQLSAWMKPIAREVVFIDTASASAPFLKACAGPKRILVSATKSGDEVFYSRFGEPFAKAIAGAAEADMDQDQQVSVLEAFLYASKQVDKFYESEERIVTEHALLDDNGDANGARASGFEGVRGKQGVADGLRAQELHLVLSELEANIPADIRAKRDALERSVREVVAKRSTMKEDEYYQELEKLFLEIAKLSK